MSGVNLRTVYAFAREMYPKNVTTPVQYGTAGFRSRWVKLGSTNQKSINDLEEYSEYFPSAIERVSVKFVTQSTLVPTLTETSSLD